MKKQFIPYELALKLKELRFNEECLARYCIVTEWEHPTGEVKLQFNTNCSVNDKFLIKSPLWQQAFDWFRKEYQINSEINYLPNIEKWGIIVSDIKIKPKDLTKDENFIRGAQVTNNFKRFDTYEEARLACLEKLIELCQQN